MLFGLAYRFTIFDDDTTATFNNFTTQNLAYLSHLLEIFIQNQTHINIYNTLLLGLRFDRNSIHENILTPHINYKINNNDKSSILRFSSWTGYRVAQIFTEDHATLIGSREVIFLDDLKSKNS